jgi:hypothetical protein
LKVVKAFAELIDQSQPDLSPVSFIRATIRRTEERTRNFPNHILTLFVRDFDLDHVLPGGFVLTCAQQDGKKEHFDMNLNNGIGEQAINKTIEDHPVIGEILQKYDIGCVTCGVGICLVKDVVSIHALGDDVEAQIETEINDYLATRNAKEGEAA